MAWIDTNEGAEGGRRGRSHRLGGGGSNGSSRWRAANAGIDYFNFGGTMKRREAALIEALDRVGDFVTHNEPVVARALTDNARARLTSLQDRLLSHMKTQAAAQQVVRDRTRIKHELRRAVVEEHMQPISLLAQAELGLPATTFRVPSVRTKFSDVVAAGYGMAEAAAKYKDGLVAAGLPEDFLERLVAATDALR